MRTGQCPMCDGAGRLRSLLSLAWVTALLGLPSLIDAICRKEGWPVCHGCTNSLCNGGSTCQIPPN
jgi:hypothetical protein